MKVSVEQNVCLRRYFWDELAKMYLFFLEQVLFNCCRQERMSGHSITGSEKKKDWIEVSGKICPERIFW